MSSENGTGRNSKGQFTPGNTHGVGPPGNTHAENRATHGLKAMRRRVMQLGSRFLDRRYTIGRELSDWRDAVAGDLGGNDNLSTFQREILDQLVADKLLVDTVSRWIIAQGPAIINQKKRRIAPVVLERSKLIDSMTKRMEILGLDRRAKDVTNDLQTYLESIRDNDKEAASEGESQG